MTSKILRADGVTELANIKSVEFHETVNAETDLRPGCVASSYINVECYGSQNDAPVGGEALTYYQVVGETETLIGIFYAEPGISSKTTYSFTAYDSAIKLDTDFSNWLSANASSFPVTVGTLVAMACSVAGVTLSGTFPMANVSVDAFYADNITCRNILSWAAEIAGKFVHCNTSGELVFDWYTDATGYRIYPHSGTSGGETLIAYKQDGLNYKNYNARRISAVAIQPSGVEGAAYIYPASVTAVYATDPNNNGNVILYNLTAVDSSSNVTLSGDFDAYDTSGVGDVDIDAHVLADNTLMVTANAILSAVDTSDLMDVAENIYNAMRTIPPYRPCEAELFPNENPFRAGQIIQVTDIQGVGFTTVLMEMVVTDSAAVLLSTGNERHQDYSRDTAAKLVQLGADLVRINKLKVDWAEINRIFANDITVTGKLHSEDYDYTDGDIYANVGMGMDFGEKIFNTPYFGLDSDGKLYATGGSIAGFQIEVSKYSRYSWKKVGLFDANGNISYNYWTEGDNPYIHVNESGTLYLALENRIYASSIARYLNNLSVWCKNSDTTLPDPTAKVIYGYASSSGVESDKISSVTSYYEESWGAFKYTGAGNIYDVDQEYVHDNLNVPYVIVEVKVNAGDELGIISNYGVESALYKDSSSIGGSEYGLYFGDDGLSIGDKIILSKDNGAEFNVDVTFTGNVDGINESDSDYCKMPDGTLICWGSVSNTAQGYGVMTFPVAFISVPNVTATPYYSSGGGGLNCRVIVQPTTTGGNIYFRQLTSTAISTETNQQAYYIAIGRWK